VPLASGRVLVAGGTGGVRTTELFDPASATWSATGDLHFAHAEAAAIELPSGAVLIDSGLGTNGLVLPVVETWDPEEGTWAPTTPALVPRHGHTLTLLGNGQVLSAGGRDGDGTTSTWSELFDHLGTSWTA